MKKLIHFRSEPHSKECPHCGVTMTWSPCMAPAGGWTCPTCGLKICYK